MSWQEAMVECQKENGELVTIYDAEESEFIHRLAVAHSIKHSDHITDGMSASFYIGATAVQAIGKAIICWCKTITITNKKCYEPIVPAFFRHSWKPSFDIGTDMVRW